MAAVAIAGPASLATSSRHSRTVRAAGSTARETFAIAAIIAGIAPSAASTAVRAVPEEACAVAETVNVDTARLIRTAASCDSGGIVDISFDDAELEIVPGTDFVARTTAPCLLCLLIVFARPVDVATVGTRERGIRFGLALFALSSGPSLPPIPPAFLILAIDLTRSCRAEEERRCERPSRAQQTAAWSGIGQAPVKSVKPMLLHHVVSFLS